MVFRKMRLQRLSLAIATVLWGCGSSAVQDNAPGEADGGVVFPTDASAVDAAITPGVDGAMPACGATPAVADPLEAKRGTCVFTKGAKVADTLGITPAQRAALPITHVIVVMQENRSFDHYFGQLSKSGQPDAEGWPATFTNPDLASKKVSPMHAPSTCLIGDPPHQGAAMIKAWDTGKMDGFVQAAAIGGSNGYYTMSYYDQTDIPFYYWLANTFAISDRYFSAALAGTWANRDYLYAGTSDGVTDTGERAITVPTIYDALDTAHVPYGVYSDGGPRQNSIGWTSAHPGFFKFPAFLAALKAGTLPPVVFVDPGAGQDEHPPADVQGGEAFARQIYDTALASPLWKELAIFYTYDESGGLADHVPSPKACIASASENTDNFNHHGVRVPITLISPWARPHYVSHVVHDHTSVLRFIELLHDLPALTGRDAAADAMLDMFDFGCPLLTTPPAAVAVGTGGCP